MIFRERDATSRTSEDKAGYPPANGAMSARVGWKGIGEENLSPAPHEGVGRFIVHRWSLSCSSCCVKPCPGAAIMIHVAKPGRLWFTGLKQFVTRACSCALLPEPVHRSAHRISSRFPLDFGRVTSAQGADRGIIALLHSELSSKRSASSWDQG